MFNLPFRLIRRKRIEEVENSLMLANQELQTCVSALFQQKREYEEEMIRMHELYAGSSFVVGGLSMRWKKGPGD